MGIKGHSLALGGALPTESQPASKETSCLLSFFIACGTIQGSGFRLEEKNQRNNCTIIIIRFLIPLLILHTLLLFVGVPPPLPTPKGGPAGNSGNGAWFDHYRPSFHYRPTRMIDLEEPSWENADTQAGNFSGNRKHTFRQKLPLAPPGSSLRSPRFWASPAFSWFLLTSVFSTRT